MIYSILQAIHVLVCIVLIIVVLMQSSKGGGLAGAFGGGGDQTVFGGRETATFLSKATTYLAVAFMILSLSLAFLASKRSPTGPESALRQASQREGNVIPRGQSVEEILGSTGRDTTAADTTKTK
jgi:preprotein translocase subunit SecG